MGQTSLISALIEPRYASRSDQRCLAHLITPVRDCGKQYANDRSLKKATASKWQPLAIKARYRSLSKMSRKIFPKFIFATTYRLGRVNFFSQRLCKSREICGQLLVFLQFAHRHVSCGSVWALVQRLRQRRFCFAPLVTQVSVSEPRLVLKGILASSCLAVISAVNSINSSNHLPPSRGFVGGCSLWGARGFRCKRWPTNNCRSFRNFGERGQAIVSAAAPTTPAFAPKLALTIRTCFPGIIVALRIDWRAAKANKSK